jgi:anaerobic ribonucleoside-triphosphate reductase
MSKVIPVEVYSRVCGYYRPVSQWNKAKQQEFCERKEADGNKIMQEATA